MNSVSTATKLVPLCSAQKRTSAAVSVITVINRAIYRSREARTTPALWRRARALTSAALPCRVPSFECGPGSLPDARLSDPYLRSVAPSRCGSAGAAIGVGASKTRPRSAPLYRSAGSLRNYPVRDRCVLAVVRRRRRAAVGKRVDVDRTGRRPVPRYNQPQARYRRGGVGHHRTRGPVGSGTAAFSGQQRSRDARGHAVDLPLSRSAARTDARQHHAASTGHHLDPAADGGAGLHRVPDTDLDRRLARGGAALLRAEPAPPGRVLRVTAGAAAIQTNTHGRGVRPLFPDRAVFS